MAQNTRGQLAGSPVPSLQLLDVDSRGFPSVSLLVDVAGLNAANSAGVPPQGLSAADFLISEDGQPVPLANVTLTAEETQGLSLILLLDKSTEPANWPGIQSAIQALFAALQPQDALAAITYNEQALTLFAFQNDWAASQSALNAVIPGGSFSALNPALTTALQLTQSAPTQRRAIIVIGDSPDNISTTPSFFDVLNQAQVAQVPIYLFGYGEKMQAFPEVQSLSTSTGGRAYIRATSAEIGSPLAQLIPWLRPTYRLSYLSQLQADNQSHSVSVSLPALGAATTSPSQIVASPGSVTVSIPNLSQGQRVGGEVNLTAAASAPAPITSVRYLLDGTDLLADVDDIGYSIIWDSTTVAPGTHQLEVTVTDSVGNQGQASVRFDVVAPLQVAIFPPQPLADAADTALRVDGEILLQAEISALDGVNRAEFFVDRMLAGTLEGEPYRIPFQTTGFDPGLHTVTVRVSDSQGREAVETLEFQLEAAPQVAAPVEPAGATSTTTLTTVLASVSSFVTQSLRVLFYLLLTATIGIITFFGGRWLLTPKPQEPLTTCRFVVANTGNAASHYHLAAKEQTGSLSFEMQVEGAPLQPPMLTRLPGHPEGLSENGLASHRNGAAHLASNGSATGSFRRAANSGVGMPNVNIPSVHMPSVNMPDTSKLKNGVNLEDANDTVDEVMVISRALADVLNTVAYLLPSNLGRPLRSIARTIRQGQMMGRRFQRAQQQVAKLKNVSEGTKTAAGASKVASSVGEIATAESTHEKARCLVNQAAGGVGTLTSGAYAATATGLSQGGAYLANAYPPQGAAATVGDMENDARQRLGQGLHSAVGTRPSPTDMFENGVARGGSIHGSHAAHEDRLMGAEGWVETPYLMPGQTLTIDLVIQLEKKFARSTQLPFKLLSRAVDDANAQTIVEEASIQVPGSSWLNRQLTAMPLLRATRFATLLLFTSLLFTSQGTSALFITGITSLLFMTGIG